MIGRLLRIALAAGAAVLLSLTAGAFAAGSAPSTQAAVDWYDIAE